MTNPAQVPVALEDTAEPNRAQDTSGAVPPGDVTEPSSVLSAALDVTGNIIASVLSSAFEAVA